MSILKTTSTTCASLVFAAALALSSASVFAADAAAPEATAPAADAVAEPAAAAPEAAAAPADAAPAVEAAAPAEPAAPAAAASTLKASDFALGAVVVGSDGKQVGTINRVRSEASGMVSEIHVATSATNVIAVPGDKIASGGKDVKLSLTSDEAGKLPAVGGKEG